MGGIYLYDSNGEYGKVRIADSVCSDSDKNSLFCYVRTFWHSCNDLYGIRRPNGCDNILILVTLDGHATLEFNDSEYELKHGSVAIIKPFLPHFYYCDPGSAWTFYGIHIENNFVSSIIEKIINDNGVCFTHNAPQALADILEHIIIESQIRSFKYSPEISMLVSDFIHLLFQKKEIVTSSSKSVTLFERAVKYIELNYASDISIDSISAMLYVSSPHFIRVFKQYAGVTPHQYIEKYRMIQARILLCNTILSIKEIANTVGYKSVSNFISHFKNHKGVTPAEYRKNLDKYEIHQNLPPPYYTKDNKPGPFKYKIF